MAKTHNFHRLIQDDRAPTGMSVWRCEKCDTEAVFDNRHTKHDVNKLMTIKMPCLPPVSGRN